MNEVKKELTKNEPINRPDIIKEVVFADVSNRLDSNNGILVNEINRLCSIVKEYTGVNRDNAVRNPMDTSSILTSLNSLSYETTDLINYLSNIINELEIKIK